MRFLTILALLIIPVTASAKTPEARLVLSIYKDLNEICRGGSGDRTETLQACNVRNDVSALLRNIGYCWAGAWWRKCRPGQAAPADPKANSEFALSIYKGLNEICRGGSGDRSETIEACKTRNKADTLLRKMGYCWRRAWWQKCRS